MRKTAIALALTTMLLFANTSCITIIDKSADTAIKASKTYKTKNVAVEEFNAIKASSAIDVVYTRPKENPRSRSMLPTTSSTTSPSR